MRLMEPGTRLLLVSEYKGSVTGHSVFNSTHCIAQRDRLNGVQNISVKQHVFLFKLNALWVHCPI